MTRFIAPRYLENVLLSLPLGWALLSQILPAKPGARLAASILLLLPFADELNARHTYARHRANLVSLRACTDAYYRGDNDGFCAAETLFEAGHLRGVLDRAQELKLSFTDIAMHPTDSASDDLAGAPH